MEDQRAAATRHSPNEMTWNRKKTPFWTRMTGCRESSDIPRRMSLAEKARVTPSTSTQTISRDLRQLA